MSAIRKPNLSMFNASDDDEPPAPIQSAHSHAHSAATVDTAKLQQFTSGSVRKSRKDKEREAAEAKAREEEERAREAYAEFLDDFATGPAEKREGKGFVRAGGALELGDGDGAGVGSARGRGEERAKVWEEERAAEPVPPAGGARHRAGGKRAMDAFLEEIKRDQAMREHRLQRTSQVQGSSVTALAALESQRGSRRDLGDPETTNIFVANLPTGVTEQALGLYFARCGPVGSVKIMWPRNEEPPALPGGPPTGPRRQGGLSGFVCFMKRRDAEVAVGSLDGQEWNGSSLRVGWSKAVSVPLRAMFDLGPGMGSKRAHSRSRSPARHNKSRYSRSRSRSPRQRDRDSRDRPPQRDRARDNSRPPEAERRRYPASRSRSRSRSPEQGVRGRYHDDSRAGYRSGSREGRGRRRASDADEDYRRRERERTPELVPFDEDGANSIYSTDSAEDSERETHRKGSLGKLALRRFESMLRGTTGKRGEVAKLMSFALDHADAAPEVASIILRSLQVDSTPVPRKVARLHLICDILHNSAASVPNAWKFRQEFEGRLGAVFDHMAAIYASFPGRITAETFKKQITAVLDVWEDWIVFPPERTMEYRRRLDGAGDEEEQEVVVEEDQEEEVERVMEKPRFKASAFKPAEELEEDVDGEAMEDEHGAGMDYVDGVPMADVDGAPMDDVDGAPMDDVDGTPMDDVDGAPMDDLDGAPLDDVDGAPLDDVDGASPGEDIDGAPLDENVDGSPLDEDDGVDAAPRKDNADGTSTDAAEVDDELLQEERSGPMSAGPGVEEEEEEDMAIDDD